MEFKEYIAILIAGLGLLIGVITVWCTAQRPIHRLFNGFLICIFTLSVLIVVFTTVKYTCPNWPDCGTDPTETTHTGETDTTSTQSQSGKTTGTTMPPPPKPETPPEFPLKTSEIGDTGFFGAYEQDTNTSNRQEPIEWVVLDKENDRALLMSVEALDCQPYNRMNVGCTWATCTLRDWLNGTFYKAAFSAEQRERIIQTQVEAHSNPDYSTNPGINTEDYIFLLSVDEVIQYLPYDTDRMCAPTEYTVKQGAFRAGDLGTGWWWLRTPGNTSADAASINSDGTIDTDDGSVNSNRGCVRPVMWVKCDE